MLGRKLLCEELGDRQSTSSYQVVKLGLQLRLPDSNTQRLKSPLSFSTCPA